MPEPCLSVIVPSYGHPSGGELVRIMGSEFQVSSFGNLETMEVFFDGHKAIDVRVYSPELLTCRTPRYRGEPGELDRNPEGLGVEVKLINLGPPPLERGYEGAYRYRRADLSRPGGLMGHIVRGLIVQMRRSILTNIVVHTQVDFSSSEPGIEVIEFATLPGIALFGPDIDEDRRRRDSEQIAVQDLQSLIYTKYHIQRIEKWQFTASLVGRNMNEAINLAQEFTMFFEKNPILTISPLEVNEEGEVNEIGEVDEEGEEGELDEMEEENLEFDLFLTQGPARAGGPNKGGAVMFNATFEIHGVYMDDDQARPVELGPIMGDPAQVELGLVQKNKEKV